MSNKTAKEIIDEGGPAFPCHGSPREVCSGMTLRQYYAGRVISGKNLDYHSQEGLERVARKAFAIADAMLKEERA